MSVAALLWTAGCGSSTPVKTTVPAGPASVTAGSTAAGVPASPSASPDVAMPSSAQLRSALLTVTDLGSAWTKMPSDSSSSGGGSDSPVGCPQLDQLSGQSAAGKNEVDVQFEGNKAGPFLGEVISTGTPAAVAAFYAQAKAGMTSCTSLTFGTGSDRMKLAASPISFGGADTAALRLDGTTSGVQITGYLTIDNLHTAVMGYFYLELMDGPSQVAYAIHNQAVGKAQKALGGA